MCLGNRTDSTKLDQITRDPSKDLYDLIDANLNPLCNACNYVEPEDTKDLNIKGTQLVSLHLNIHSIPDKLDQLKTYY